MVWRYFQWIFAASPRVLQVFSDGRYSATLPPETQSLTQQTVPAWSVGRWTQWRISSLDRRGNAPETREIAVSSSSHRSSTAWFPRSFNEYIDREGTVTQGYPGDIWSVDMTVSLTKESPESISYQGISRDLDGQAQEIPVLRFCFHHHGLHTASHSHEKSPRS